MFISSTSKPSSRCTCTLTAFSGNSVETGPNPSGVLKVYAAIRHTDGGSAAIGWYDWNQNKFVNGGTISDPPPAPPCQVSDCAWNAQGVVYASSE